MTQQPSLTDRDRPRGPLFVDSRAEIPGLVVVGAGHAGGCAASALRAGGYQGRLVLIGAEPYQPYQRPPLSKAMLRTNGTPVTSVAGLFLKPRDYYGKAEIELYTRATAVSIDRTNRSVMLADGRRFEYERLLLTLGSTPRRLDVPGANLSGFFYLRTLDECLALSSQLRAGARLVVIGGGFIGLEVAAAARERGAAVTVLEAGDRLMSRGTDAAVAAFFLDLHRRHGVDVRTGVRVEAILGRSCVEAVGLQGGETIDADLVVVGIGILPNVALAAAAHLKIDDGILTDPDCRTSDPDIFAAGDVARQFHPLINEYLRLEAWQNAQNQATVAALNMAGASDHFCEVPWMWSEQYGVDLQIAGFVGRGDRRVMRGRPQEGSFIVFELMQGTVVSVCTVNRGADMVLARRLIARKASVDAAVLADEVSKLRSLT